VQEIQFDLAPDDDFDVARSKARQLGLAENPESEIISWHNREADTQSPCCLHCDFGDVPAWEVYGRNHGGRIKVTAGDGRFVFIVS